jgi:U6 snRNA-associated Sm-like protein LSm8
MASTLKEWHDSTYIVVIVILLIRKEVFDRLLLVNLCLDVLAGSHQHYKCISTLPQRFGLLFSSFLVYPFVFGFAFCVFIASSYPVDTQRDLTTTTTNQSHVHIAEVVLVATSDGRILVGTLAGYDQVQNVILKDTHERIYIRRNSNGNAAAATAVSGDDDVTVERVPLGLYVVRGDSLCLIADFDDTAAHNEKTTTATTTTGKNEGGGDEEEDTSSNSGQQQQEQDTRIPFPLPPIQQHQF